MAADWLSLVSDDSQSGVTSTSPYKTSHQTENL